MIFWFGIILNALGVAMIVIVLSFAPPNSFLRPALFPLVVALGLYTITFNREGLSSKAQASFVTIHTVGMILQYVDYGLISRWAFNAQGPTSLRGGQYTRTRSPASFSADERETKSPTVWARIKWGLFAATAWRAVGTPWEVKNTPTFDKREPKRIPTRRKFLGHTLAKLMLCLLVLDALSLGQKPENNATDFTWQKVAIFARWREVSIEEISSRIIISLLCWASMYCIIQAVYCSMALIAVAIYITPIDAWPPLFGSIKESYSLRQFWGYFWHQCIRSKVASPAYFATYSLLRLRKGGKIARYICILLTFATSGLLHLAEEYGAGVPLHQSGSMRFYCFQALGILLEDAVQAISRSSIDYKQSPWTKAVGYIWLVVWMSWTTPAWFYPKLMNNTGSEKDQVLPFSLLAWLL